MHSIKNNHLRFVQKCDFSDIMHLIKILSKYAYYIKFIYIQHHYTIYINSTKRYYITIHACFTLSIYLLYLPFSHIFYQ